jgi:hypothetical protein
MTQDEIIQIARRSYKSCEHIPNVKIPPEFIERFAKLVAQHERDACAKIADNFAMTSQYKTQRSLAEWCASSIRARGQA